MITQNDPRRWKERADGSMISEDPGAVANLSPNLIMKEVKSVPLDPYNGNIPAYGKRTPIESGLEVTFMGAVTRKGRAI